MENAPASAESRGTRLPWVKTPPLSQPVFFIATCEDFARTTFLTHEIPWNGELSGALGHARWSARFTKKPQSDNAGEEVGILFEVHEGVIQGACVGLCWVDLAWSEQNYVLLPGAVYAGNRFDALRRPYPPEARHIGQGPDSTVLDIGDIPRLNLSQGKSYLSQLSVDCAVPGLAIHFPGACMGLILLTNQETREKNPYHLEILESDDRSQARIYWSAPGFIPRFDSTNESMPQIGNVNAAYLHPENRHPRNLGPGDTICMEGLLSCFECQDIHALFGRLFDLRSWIDQAPPPRNVLSFSQAFDLIHAKYEADNWDEDHGLYKVGLPWLAKQDSQFWQNGWLGGGIPLLPFVGVHDEAVCRRVFRNFEFFLQKGLSEFGIFKAIMSPGGKWSGDGFADWDGGAEPFSLSRRSADGLFFACRMLHYLRTVEMAYPSSWDVLVRRCADALCDVWKRHQDFGFLINYDTGGLVIGGSTSGALIPAGLVLAFRLFGEVDYLDVAKMAAQQFALQDLARGVTTGGPGDAVQAPDSESIVALLESLVLLYEETSDPAWLVDATHAAWQFSSWVLAYKHRFPRGSAMDEMHIDTRGVIFANAQNKCAVPGICTLSGEGLLRLARHTGSAAFLDILAAIAHAIPQFVSTTERPIPARIPWGHPDKRHLPPGWICERVNVSPWWYEPLGEQAAYSCWCEVAMLLTWNDLPGVYARPDTGLIQVLDHVDARWKSGSNAILQISNPLPAEVTVKVLIENFNLAQRPLPANAGMFLPTYRLQAGEMTEIDVSIE